MTSDSATVGAAGTAETPQVPKEPIGWVFDPPEPCGGISANGAEPPVCEVHLAPWGHARPECVQ